MKGNWGPIAVVLVCALTGGSSCGLVIFQFGSGVDGDGARLTQPWAAWMFLWAMAWPVGVALGFVLAKSGKGWAALGLLAWVPGFFGLLASGAPKRWLLDSVRADCEQGDAPSCHRMASYFRRGRLLPKDEDAAIESDRKSCRLGFVYACAALVESDSVRHGAEVCPLLTKSCATPHPPFVCARAMASCAPAGDVPRGPP